MDTLLMVAVVLITLAVVAQAGVLIAMYMMSRRVAAKAEALMDDGRRIMQPMETVTGNLKAVADDLGETGKIARSQVLHVQDFVKDTETSVRHDIAQIRERVFDTVDEASDSVMRPIRHFSAIASGIAEGIRVFFGQRRDETTTEEEHPAA
jgi:hypothetical protein